MADNPGIRLPDARGPLRDITYIVRPGTILPSFAQPVIGFHNRLDDLAEKIRKGPDYPRVPSINPVRSYGSEGSSPGILLAGWYDTFWKNRVHMIPAGYELGSVITAQQRSFDVYNAGETPDDSAIIDSITINDGEGFSIISGEIVTPYVLGAGESSLYTWEVLPEGPPTILTTVDFAIDSGDYVIVHSITGTRLVLLSYQPQAANSEVFEFYTAVIDKSGFEQRLTTRDAPKHMLDAEFHLDDHDGHVLENVIYNRGFNAFQFPYWREATNLTATLAIGVSNIPVGSTVSRSFRAGDLALIWHDSETFEAVEVSQVNATSLDISNPTLEAHAQPATVLPILNIYLNDNIQTDLFPADDLRIFRMTMTEASPTKLADDSAFTQYRSMPVWEDDLTLGAEQYRRVISWDIIRTTADKSNPNFTQTTRNDRPKLAVEGYQYFAEDIAAVRRLIDWIGARDGRRKAFWVSTEKRDFEVGLDEIGVSTTIEILNVKYQENVNAGQGRNDIRIEYVDGSIDYRRIVSVLSVPSTNEELTLDSATSQIWSAANVAKVSYMQLVRYAVDKFEFKFARGNDGTLNVPVVEVEES